MTKLSFITAILCFNGYIILAQTEIPKETGKTTKFWHSKTCKNCHTKIYEHFTNSMHARSYDNKAFQAQYYRDVVPYAHKNKGF